MNVSNDVLGAIVAVCLALLGVVWGLLRGQNAEQGGRIAKLEAQNVDQQKDITRLQAQMVAREEAHHQHREDVAGRLATIDSKLDRLLFGKRSDTPNPEPGRYGGRQT